jgi:hypothetical protein
MLYRLIDCESDTVAMKCSKSNDNQALVTEPEHEESLRGNSSAQNVEEPEGDNLAGQESETYGNRIYT